MSAHENKENTKRSARTTRATHPVWVRMEPRSLTKKKLKRKMIGSPQNSQNLPTIYNLAHALETVKTKRKVLFYVQTGPIFSGFPWPGSGGVAVSMAGRADGWGKGAW